MTNTAGLTTIAEDPRIVAKRIFSLIAQEMALVEAEFERQAQSNVQVIAFLGEYLRSTGGKRVRPALTILSTHAVGGDGSRYNSIRMAAVMEFLHTATLVHDDVIDNAKTRRNRPSLNSRFGNQTAVLMGDWLYMSAFETSLAERSLSILDILTAMTRKMTEGELIQLTTLGRSDVTAEQYFEILERKTAYLFSACCEIGAILGRANAEQQQALRDYGLNLGIAFQLADDLLDFMSSEEALGKGAGTDLLEGKITLPLILSLESDPTLRSDIERVIRTESYDEVPREKLIRAAERAGALDATRQRAFQFAEVAKAAVDELPDSKYSDALRSIPSYVVERDY